MHYLVLNKNSGLFTQSLYKKIEKFANIYCKEHLICFTKKSGTESFIPDLPNIPEEGDTLVVIGGDGTVNLCLNYLHKLNLTKKITLAIIPRGTGNNMLLALSLSKSIKKSFEILKMRKYLKLQYGIINNKYAFFNCSIGFSAYILKNRRFKSRNGYILDAIKNFSYKPDYSVINYNNTELKKAFFHGYFINTTHYASIMPFMKYPAYDKKLRFFHSSKKNILENLNMIIKTIQGQDDIDIVKSQKFLLTPGDNCFLEIDGDIVPSSKKYTIEVAGDIEVICG